MSAPPPLTDRMRAEARSMPGRWLYAVDPFFDPDGAVPPYGVIGAWRVDEHGEVSEEFTPNPGHRPSPVSLGFGEPADPLDAAVQLAVTGYSDGGDLVPLLLESEVLTGTDAEGRIPVYDPGVVLAYTSRAHLPGDLPAGVSGWQVLRGSDLVGLMPQGVDLALNAEGHAGVRVPRPDGH
ncbi:type VII secretion system-associated protein [Streptosporangium longisporum]|uniref:Type VII secretion system-associated protein n=1 Tax=Streptosporangium longisporum TaxID=46187 RepID=A0ABN3XS39_9ACTN